MNGNFIKNGYTNYSTTTRAKRKSDVWHINGTKLLENHPRFEGIRAAIDYLNIKQAKKRKRKPLDWHICIEMLDTGLTIILIGLLISVIVLK